MRVLIDEQLNWRIARVFSDVHESGVNSSTGVRHISSNVFMVTLFKTPAS